MNVIHAVPFLSFPEERKESKGKKEKERESTTATRKEKRIEERGTSKKLTVHIFSSIVQSNCGHLPTLLYVSGHDSFLLQ
jgi:hypothetical protein